MTFAEILIGFRGKIYGNIDQGYNNEFGTLVV